MKKKEVKNLIREYLALKKRVDRIHEELLEIRNSFGRVVNLGALRNKEQHLREEISEVRERFEEVGNLLYGYRSKTFIRSVLSCVLDLGGEYQKDEYYHHLLANLISILRRFEKFNAERREYTSIDLLHFYNEEVE